MDYPTPSGPRKRGAASKSCIWLIAAVSLAVPVSAWVAASPALALSEIKREELPAPSSPAQTEESPEKSVPFPDPVQPPPADLPIDPEKTGPTEPETPDDLTQPGDDADAALPEVVYDVERLPPDVKRMRELLIEAAKSGDIERLRPLLGPDNGATQFSLGAVDGDPIAFLKGLSGDDEGREILAIMEEVLSAGHVHLDAGTPEELYVWPYFFAIPLDRLDARQHVELFKIVTAGDFEEMKNFGSYIFYRLGITPEGRWAFFVAGE